MAALCEQETACRYEVRNMSREQDGYLCDDRSVFLFTKAAPNLLTLASLAYSGVLSRSTPFVIVVVLLFQIIRRCTKDQPRLRVSDYVLFDDWGLRISARMSDRALDIMHFRNIDQCRLLALQNSHRVRLKAERV